MLRRIRVSALAVLALAAVLTPAIADMHEPAALAYVVHGIPGPDDAPVDVLINGELCALTGFTFGTIFGPVPLAPGDYTFEIYPANIETPCSGDLIVDGFATVEAGGNYSVVAHLDEFGAPLITAFANNVAPTAPGTARAILHHTAAVGPVDIAVQRPVDGDSDDDTTSEGETDDEETTPPILIPGFGNGDQVEGSFRPGNWQVELYPAGAMDPAVGPVYLKFKPSTAKLVYAVGSLDDGSFTLLEQEISLKPKKGKRGGVAGERAAQPQQSRRDKDQRAGIGPR